jgi:hypothetical protein
MTTLTDRLNGVSTSLAVKAPCKAVTSAPITLSGEQTVNGVACVEGDRVLVKDQADAIENGIYNVRLTAWERAADFDGNLDVAKGTLVILANAIANGVIYAVSTADPIVIGTSEIEFALRDDPAQTYPQTQAEIDASVTPVNLAYPAAHLFRYGANTVPGTTDMTTPLLNALKVGDALVPEGIYRITQNIALDRYGIIGAGAAQGGSTRVTRFVFYNLTSTTQGAFYTSFTDLARRVVTLRDFEISASSWDGSTGALGYGLEITAVTRIQNVSVFGFKKSGLFLHSTASAGEAPYQSLIENLFVVYSGEHGILVGTGANNITFINCQSYSNGAPSHFTAPSSAGNYDGFHLAYLGDANPGSAFDSYVPEGIRIIGGDCSYNSRYGWNFVGCQGGQLEPNYAEGNFAASTPQVNLTQGLTNCLVVVGAVASRAAGVNFGMLANFADGAHTNRVLVGGRDCGSGNSNTETSRYSYVLGRLVSWVAYNDAQSNAAYITGDNAGIANLSVSGTGKWNLNSTPLHYAGTAVVQARRTGWTAATGTATRTTFATTTVTTEQLAERVKALLDDLIAHGLIGT